LSSCSPGLVAGLVLAASMLCACNGRGSAAGPANPPLDDWIRFGSSLHESMGRVPAGMIEVPFLRVEEAAQASARARLQERSYEVLDRDSAHGLLPSGVSIDAHEGIPVLLRAVRTPADSSGLAADDRFVVRWRAGEVLVSTFGERERWDLRQVRHAIVAWVPELPQEVYVEDVMVIIGGIEVD
jgi:hypothetical protein